MRKIAGGLGPKSFIGFMVTLVIVFSIISPKNAWCEETYANDINILRKVTEEHIFYENKHFNLYRIDMEGDNKILLGEGSKYYFDREWIYYFKRGVRIDTLVRVKYDGSNKEIIHSDYGIENYFVIDNTIYYVGGKGSRINIIDLNNRTKRTVKTGIVFDFYKPYNFNSDSKYLYFRGYNNQGEGIFKRVDIRNNDMVEELARESKLKSEKPGETGDISTIIVSNDDFIIYTDHLSRGCYKYSFKSKEKTLLMEGSRFAEVKGKYVILKGNYDEKIFDIETLEVKEFDDLSDSEKQGYNMIYFNQKFAFYGQSIDSYGSLVRENLIDESDNGIWKMNINESKNYKYGETRWLKDEYTISLNNGELKKIKIEWENNRFIDTSKIGKGSIRGTIDGRDEPIILDYEIGDIDSEEALIKALLDGKKELYFADEWLKEYYLECKRVIDLLITEEMSEIEKELIITEYLNDINISNKTIDFQLRTSKIFNLEGQVAKTAAVLLNLAGIETHLSRDGISYWNVVKIDGEYYNLIIHDFFEYQWRFDDLNIKKFSRGNIYGFNVPDEALPEYFNLDSFQCEDDRFSQFNSFLEELRENYNLKKIFENGKIIFYLDFGKKLYRVNKKDATVEVLLEGTSK